MGTRLSSELGKVKGSEEEEWHRHTIADTSWLFNSHFPDGH